MVDRSLHIAQLTILQTLRHHQTARFSALMRPTKLTSDVFKFHLRKLVHEKLVQKNSDGAYQLTIRGKEFANTLDRHAKQVQKQPKVSVLLIVEHVGSNGDSTYLVQQRLRHPFYGYWGFLSGPVLWGVSFEDAAQKELRKQTGLSTNLTVRTLYRQRDKTSSAALLEDKVFIIMHGYETDTTLTNEWHGGTNAWMTLAQLQSQTPHFSASASVIALLESGKSYADQDLTYPLALY